MLVRVSRFTVGVLSLLAAAAHADVFSPGDLAKPHSNLEGMSNCTRCHPAGEQLSQQLCLDCHSELKPEIGATRGYHGRIPTEKRDCEQCHHEHQGKEFKLVDWGKEGMKAFDHGKTGWPLVGKHQPVACLTCHEKRFITVPAIVTLLKKYPDTPTMLGTPRTCANCHFDEHRGQLKKGCDTCHKETGWSPVPLFNHNKTVYPLKGKHAAVACAKCHPVEKDTETAADVFPKPFSTSFARYAPVAHQSCLDCHADVHKGAFGPRCESCHVVEGWLIIKNGPKEREFHEKTQFPLRGAHITVACGACHGPFPGEPAKFKGLPFANCSDCHPDGHEGQLVKLTGDSKVPGCDRCHTVQVFQPATFDVKDHDKTSYPLTGAHAAVACSACHTHEAKLVNRIPPIVRTLLKRRHRQELFSQALLTLPGANDRCESCHQDPHGGQFKKGSKLKPCASCHEVASWSKLVFDHNRDTRYPLTGKHAEAPCQGCHPVDAGKTVATVRYAPLETACGKCHTDAHAGQLASGAPAQTRCDTCHDTGSWKAPLFVHAQPFTDYLIEGEHQKVACIKCHPEVTVAPGVRVTRYKPLGRECEDCHADFHKGAFEGFQP
jgi:hypothetical protein